MIEVDPFGFSPDNHTLTVTFTDVTGSVGVATEFRFNGQTREGGTAIAESVPV